MVWLGQLSQALPQVIEAAENPLAERYHRITAIRALAAIGSASDLDRLRAKFLAEAPELNRDWLAEILEITEPTRETVPWLVSCLAKTPPKERYHVDKLTQELTKFVSASDPSHLPILIADLSTLLSEPPLIERRHCEISSRNSWLLEMAAKASERLIEAKSTKVLEKPVLEILHKITAAKFWSELDFRDSLEPFTTIVPAWQELNRALFWYEVDACRGGLEADDKRLTDQWEVGAWRALRRFGEADFDHFAEAIRTRPKLDDRLVALSVAFVIFRDAGRPDRWRDILQANSTADKEVADRLNGYLNPPPPSEKEKDWKRQEARWKKQDEARQRKDQENKEKWKSHLVQRVDKLRNPGFDDPRAVSQDQWYLHGRMREQGSSSSRWTSGNWESLVPEFGAEVSQAFRDGAVNHWRKSDPILRSEGEEENKTPASVILGLSGLQIEANETADWISLLDEAEVIRACKYASFELNGFPKWFPALYAAYPDVVSDFLFKEINFEIENATAEKSLNYILSDVAWSGQWAWSALAPKIYGFLQTSGPSNTEVLDHLLKILQGSELSDAMIAKIAQAKVGSADNVAHLPRWFAVWVGVEPDRAVPALTSCLEGQSPDQSTSFAGEFITNLVGGRWNNTSPARTAFHTPGHLKSLYLLMHRYIRREEDINRAGGGVYSPGLRDHAQESRNGLFEILNKIPGKEAFLALKGIADAHPDAESRPWLTHLANAKAEREADLEPWSQSQVDEFYTKLDRTPTTHRQLADLAKLRVEDLKDELEQGDTSIADILVRGATLETDMRRYIGKELRDKAHGRYNIPQEEELTDAKRPDFRFLGMGFDGPVPMELKLADKWSGPSLIERLENQLCGDYLRDNRSNRGLFALVYCGEKTRWDIEESADSKVSVNFEHLLKMLEKYWQEISHKYPGVEDISVIGIDLSKRHSKLPLPQ